MASPAGAKIEGLLDCVSPYSYFALLYLLEKREVLLSHGVEIEFTPVFLGGINVGSGNKPPWTNPVKAKYSAYDSVRAKKYFKAHKVQSPSFFPILSLLADKHPIAKPQRCMVYIKSAFPQDKYEASFRELWVAMWEEQIDLSKPDKMATVLSRHFNTEEGDAIIAAANSKEWKDKLVENTERALKLGAFGAPWFWVRNAKGEEEPFFGSDRFHFMFEFLGLPWGDIELKAKM